MAWPKHLTVDKRIISLLSASTYESFPRALRELVSNSYDADATQVDITLSITDKVLTVKDNGTGMTPDEFDFFLRIAGRQRTRKRTTVLGRKRIGQFGIGFLRHVPILRKPLRLSRPSHDRLLFFGHVFLPPVFSVSPPRSKI